MSSSVSRIGSACWYREVSLPRLGLLLNQATPKAERHAYAFLIRRNRTAFRIMRGYLLIEAQQRPVLRREVPSEVVIHSRGETTHL